MTNAYGSFQVSTNVYIPFETDLARVKTIEILRNQAEAINKREVSTYDTQISPTGQSWPPVTGQTVQRRQTAFRKIVSVTIDNSSSPQSFPHGITPSGFIPTKISGVIGNGTNSFIPVPFPGTDEVLVEVTDTNVVITTSTTTWDGYTGNIIIEFLPSTT